MDDSVKVGLIISGTVAGMGLFWIYVRPYWGNFVASIIERMSGFGN